MFSGLESMSGLKAELELASGLGLEIGSGLGLEIGSGLGLDLGSGFLAVLEWVSDCALDEIEFFSGDSSSRVKRSFFCLDFISGSNTSDFFLLNLPNIMIQFLMIPSIHNS